MIWIAVATQAVCSVISIAIVGHWGGRDCTGKEPFSSMLWLAVLSVVGLAACLAVAWPAT